MYFYMIEHFADREINERSFSNPHPWSMIAFFSYLLPIPASVSTLQHFLSNTGDPRSSISHPGIGFILVGQGSCGFDRGSSKPHLGETQQNVIINQSMVSK